MERAKPGEEWSGGGAMFGPVLAHLRLTEWLCLIFLIRIGYLFEQISSVKRQLNEKGCDNLVTVTK